MLFEEKLAQGGTLDDNATFAEYAAKWFTYRGSTRKLAPRTRDRYQSLLVAHVADRAGRGEIQGHRVPVVNCPNDLRSEVGHELLSRHPEAPFVAMWSVDRNGFQGWSLRSRGLFDVSELAVTLGGGGHPASAGFRRPPGQWILVPLGD